MVMLASELISDAWYLSGIVRRELQTVSGAQMSLGLKLLNTMFSLKSINPNLIPFYSFPTFNTVIGQESYFVEGLVSADVLTFTLDNTLRMSVLKKGRDSYRGSSRVNNIKSLMFDWNFERAKGGANIKLYFLPDKVYPVVVTGKVALTSVTEDTDLSLTYEDNYLFYLQNELAKYQCQAYRRALPDDIRQELEELRYSVDQLSPTDFTIEKLSGFKSSSIDPFVFANFSQGWLP